MKKSQFKERLKRAVAWDQIPKLTDEDIDYLVDLSRTSDSYGNRVADVEAWEPSTHYEVGQTVVNEKQETFICVVDGVSGALAPRFVRKKEGHYEDGSCEWVYQGKTLWVPTYDLNRGAYEGWGLKAAKAASMISFTADGQKFDRDQYIKNCEAMQRKYPRLGSTRLRRGGVRLYPMILEVPVHDD